MFNLPRMHKKLVSISFFRIAIAILLGILYTTYRSKRERTRLILTYQCLYIRFPPFLALAYVKSRFGFSKVVNYMLAAFLCAELYSAMRRQCNDIFPLHRRMQASSKELSSLPAAALTAYFLCMGLRMIGVAKGIPFATRFFLVNHFIYYHIIIKKSTKRKYFYMQFIP